MMTHSNIRQWSLFLTWLITLIVLLTTLYFSNVLGFPVCPLCWYQRICIYPLALIIGIATFRNDGDIALYTIPMTLIGMAFALLQYIEQIVPTFRPMLVCGQGASCHMMHIHYFGFITLPLLSLIACIIMTFLLFIVHYTKE